jgi:hypothetical protein
VPRRRAPPRRRDLAVAALPRGTALDYEPLADAGDAHFLPGRGGRRGREEMPGETIGLRCALLRPTLHRRPPRGRQDRRQREHGEQAEPDMNRHQQRHGDDEPENPAARREHRHVHVIEHEHLVAQHGQPIEIVGPLVVCDRRDRRLEAGDVRFERDRDPVAEAALHTRADRTQEPGRRRRDTEPQRRRKHESGPPVDDTLAEEHEPQRDQRVGQRGELRQRERRQHQPRFVPVSEFAQPPHRRQRGRQVLVDRSAFAFS